MIDNLIFNELASHRTVALPHVGVLRVVRRSAHMEGGTMVPPRNMVVYSAVFDSETNLPTEDYDEWLAEASVSGDLVIEGVGRLTMGEFVATDELERALNGGAAPRQPEPASAASPKQCQPEPVPLPVQHQPKHNNGVIQSRPTGGVEPASPSTALRVNSASPKQCHSEPHIQRHSERSEESQSNVIARSEATRQSHRAPQAASHHQSQPAPPQWEPANYAPRDAWHPSEAACHTPRPAAAPIYTPPVQHHYERSEPPRRSSAANALLIIAIVLLLALLAGILCYVMPLRRDLAAMRAENQTLQTQMQEQAAQIEQLKTPPVVVEAVPDVPDVEKYHLIVGSFTAPARAEQRADYYRQHFPNLTVKVFDNGSGRTYVSVFQSDSKRTAYTRFLKIAEQTGNWDDMWVWERP